MKVTNTGINNLNQAIGNKDSQKTGKAEGADSSLETVSVGRDSASVKGSDRLELSERAQRMSKAREIASEQTVDEAKVARLQKMIDEGKYNVDASAIADRLVDQHLLMPE